MKLTDCSSPGRRSPRGGFTLVEMLVVIAIIAILMVLAATAAMQVLGTQRSNTTELTLKKLDTALQRQVQATIELARAEADAGGDGPTSDRFYFSGQFNPNTGAPISWGLLRMAGWDPASGSPILPGVDLVTAKRRASLIWIKLRLKQQFPMNFTEAFLPTPTSVLGLPPGMPPGSPKLPWVVLPAEPAYTTPLSSPTAFTPGPSPPAAYEPGVCLLLAISRARKGAPPIQDSLSSTETILTPFNGQKAVADAWGMPLAFYRWPIGEAMNLTFGGDLARLDPNFTSANLVNHDPLDPDGLLMNPNWNNYNCFTGTGFPTPQGAWAFEKLCHPVHAGMTSSTYVPRSYYSIPTIASAGRYRDTDDYTKDIYTFQGLAAPSELPPPPLAGLWQALVPDPMDLLNPASSKANDNIYSYRLRLGARGD